MCCLQQKKLGYYTITTTGKKVSTYTFTYFCWHIYNSPAVLKIHGKVLVNPSRTLLYKRNTLALHFKKKISQNSRKSACGHTKLAHNLNYTKS